MIMMIEDHHTKDKTKGSKNIMVGAKDHGLGGQGPNPQKRGGPGGVPKIAKFCTRGGKFGGGYFWGGPGTRAHKTWRFYESLKHKF